MKINLPARGKKLNKLGLILAILVLAVTASGFAYMYWLGQHKSLESAEEQEKKKKARERGRDSRLDALRPPKDEEPEPERKTPPADEPAKDNPPKEEKKNGGKREKDLSPKEEAELEAAREQWRMVYKAKLKLEERRINSLAEGREYLWKEGDKASDSDSGRASSVSAQSSGQSSGSGGRFGADQDKTAWANRDGGGDDRYIGEDGRIPMLSHWQVMESTAIPMRTQRGIFSGLPIGVKATVTRNVPCAVPGGTSSDICIPMGTTGVIDYNTRYEQGECRIQASLRRFIFTDNSSMDMENIPIGDAIGYAGMKDECHRHLGERLLNAVLFSAVDGAFALGGAALGANEMNVNTAQPESVAQGEMRQNMKIPPTIEIRPGYDFIASPHRDILFDGPFEPILTAIGEE